MIAGQQAVSALTIAVMGEAAHTSLVLLESLLVCVEVQVCCFLVLHDCVEVTGENIFVVIEGKDCYIRMQ